MPGLGRGIADHRAGRLDGVNCSTPADARLGAVWADGQEGGHAALSSESGALAVVTDFPPNTGRLLWSGVDLTGVRELELRAAGESEPATPGFPQPEPPPRPAVGGRRVLPLGAVMRLAYQLAAVGCFVAVPADVVVQVLVHTER
jgi:hypothetical protein